MITGNTLIQWGFTPGPSFPAMITEANRLLSMGHDLDLIKSKVANLALAPIQTVELYQTGRAFNVFLDATAEEEIANKTLVHATMNELMRIPTVTAGVLMPDACPAGIIPVGGVVATKDAIHPGFHSADICCSMAITVFNRNDDPKRVLDAAQRITHFGPVRNRYSRGPKLPANPFLKQLQDVADAHFATQGDGNHFLFVGHLQSTGQLALVTHHGSRGLGAQLYRRGMQAAQRHTRIHSPRTPAAASWIDARSQWGQDYWEALQAIRVWTNASHFEIHNRIARHLGNSVIDRFWNEHNFVFHRDDLYYHAKGATPSFTHTNYARTLIPLNMAEPILITEPTDNSAALSFAPHGAGRNMSRTKFMQNYKPTPPANIDIRYYSGLPDPSELPDAYKSAASVVHQIEKYNLAKIVDQVIPYGNIMAGEIQWRTS